MSSVVILVIGMAVVIVSVLVLRIHAFLALIAAALIVSFLTPQSMIREQQLRSDAVPVLSTGDDGTSVVLGLGQADGVLQGSVFLILRKSPATATFREVGRIMAAKVGIDNSNAISIGSRELPKLQEGDLIVKPDAQRRARSLSEQSIGQHVATGFGNTCAGIGILIAMAAIIGKCLLDSGGAERVVLAMRRSVGEERTAAAFAGSGFLLAIPVFFDTVFYLLIPLAKAMRVKTGKHYLLYVLAIVAGAAIAHSLVPPTPGPLFVANELGVDIGLMILAGLAVGIVVLPVVYAFALWADRRWDIPLRPSVDLSAEDLEAMAHRDETTLPPLWFSLLPIVLPVVLISGNTVFNLVAGSSESGRLAGWLEAIRPLIDVAGDKNVALVISAVLALLLLARQAGGDRMVVALAVQAALVSGGVIILITAAGGAFGHVLRMTGIAQDLQNALPATQFVLIPAAFATTMLIRIAQGSATVAMITASGIVGSLAVAGGLPFNPVYLVLAIGCGSMPYPWMNDSGFWIITKMSGFTEAETLRTASVVIAIAGFAGLVVTMLGAWWLPMA